MTDSKNKETYKYRQTTAARKAINKQRHKHTKLSKLYLAGPYPVGRETDRQTDKATVKQTARQTHGEVSLERAQLVGQQTDIQTDKAMDRKKTVRCVLRKPKQTN